MITREEMLANLLLTSPRIYTIVTHVARSGMSRDIRFFIVVDNQIEEVTGLVAATNRQQVNVRGAITVKGTGFDAGHAVVSNVEFRLRRSGKIAPNYKIEHGRL